MKTSLPIDVVVTVAQGGSRHVGDELIESYPSSTFRFFVRREGNRWMSSDLDVFSEAVALLQRG